MSDEFLFNFTEPMNLAHSLPVTKRSAILRLSAKIFDPLGFLSPFVIQIKIIFQEICTEKIDWDQNLVGKTLDSWNSLEAELESLEQVKIPRCYFQINYKPTSIQLHGFSDASKQAYAAAVYRLAVRLVSSKTRVAPLKRQSIPRLELLGATILTRLINTVQDSLPQEIET